MSASKIAPYLHLLGTAPDPEIACLAGCSITAVWQARQRRGVAVFVAAPPAIDPADMFESIEVIDANPPTVRGPKPPHGVIRANLRMVLAAHPAGVAVAPAAKMAGARNRAERAEYGIALYNMAREGLARHQSKGHYAPL